MVFSSACFVAVRSEFSFTAYARTKLRLSYAGCLQHERGRIVSWLIRDLQEHWAVVFQRLDFDVDNTGEAEAGAEAGKGKIISPVDTLSTTPTFASKHI